MKDALVQAALSYKNLLDTEYEFRLGTSSRKMVITLISSAKGELQQGQCKYTILEESKILKSDSIREQLYK